MTLRERGFVSFKHTNPHTWCACLHVPVCSLRPVPERRECIATTCSHAHLKTRALIVPSVSLGSIRAGGIDGARARAPSVSADRRCGQYTLTHTHIRTRVSAACVREVRDSVPIVLTFVLCCECVRVRMCVLLVCAAAQPRKC